MTQSRTFIFFGDNLLAIRIMQYNILTHRVTRVPYRKMRAGFFGNQNRQFRLNAKFTPHTVRLCIRANGKFAKRQRVTIVENILFYILFVVFLIFIIGTCITLNHAVIKSKFQIFITELIQIDLRHVKHTFRAT